MARPRGSKGKIADTGEKMQEKYDTIEAKAKARYEHLTRRVKEMEEKFEDKVREKPLQSVGIAFGAGIVAGALLMMLTRRR
ncbi:MAG: DUF883 family protein [Candidatus Woesearchaeota archaeon]